jgi:hypothetical protein
MVALLALMIGCAWITEDERAARRDRDGDGDVAAQFGGGDCDDRDASVSSRATETCNGVDDDCDGEIDNVAAPEGMVAWDDADGDGFGAPGTDTVVCQLGDAQVDNDADCDDTSADIKPGAPELCTATPTWTRTPSTSWSGTWTAPRTC